MKLADLPSRVHVCADTDDFEPDDSRRERRLAQMREYYRRNKGAIVEQRRVARGLKPRRELAEDHALGMRLDLEAGMTLDAIRRKWKHGYGQIKKALGLPTRKYERVK